MRYNLGMSGATPGSIVTLVFTDVEGSSRLWQALPDATRDALQVHDDVLRRVAGQHGGYEIRTEGDAFKFAFASPAASRTCGRNPGDWRHVQPS